MMSDGWHERTYPTAKTTDSSFCGLSQKCFEFAEAAIEGASTPPGAAGKSVRMRPASWWPG